MRLRLYPDRNEFRSLAREANLIPVCLELLADTETSVSALAKFYQSTGPVFLFESVEGGERWGRYSILGASARAQVRVYRDAVEVDQGGARSRIPHGGDPLPVLRQLLAQYRPARLPDLPRFWGGLVGYLTYEMVSFFEAIPNRLPDEAPLAHFMLTDGLLIFDNVRHTLTSVAHAYLDDKQSPDEAYERALARLQAMEHRLGQPLPPSATERPGVDLALRGAVADEAFRANVSRAKEYIRAGDVIQTVISQPFVGSPAPDPWLLYRVQRYINPSPYLFFLHLGDTVLVGSSPETLVRLESGIATLRPIAGTRPRGATEQEDRRLADDLLQDTKERAEHVMLVDLGRNDLGRVAEVGTVQVTDLMVVERYSHVMHLVSNITCDLRRDCDAWDLLRATFPAGTLTGAPKVRAMEIIAELEKEPRGPYGGAVGYVSFTGNLDLAITIRTALIQDGKVKVQAGAGIVADSDPERERQETVNKAMALQEGIRMLNQQ